MPYGRRRTYRRRRVGYRRRRPMRRRRTTRRSSYYRRKLRRFRVVDPQVMFRKIRYYEQNNSALTIGVGAAGVSYDYRMNSVYDPNKSGVGGIPSLHQMMVNSGAYGRYVVHAVKFRFRFVYEGAEHLCVGILPVRPGLTAPTTSIEFEQAFGERYGVGKMKYIGPVLNGGPQIKHIKQFYKISRLIGRKVDSGSGGDAAGLGANPSNTLDLRLVAFSAYRTTMGSANLIRFNVWITYYVKYFSKNTFTYTD